jgi:hypothetical protein
MSSRRDKVGGGMGGGDKPNNHERDDDEVSDDGASGANATGKAIISAYSPIFLHDYNLNPKPLFVCYI